MWKIVIGFAAFAGLALFILSQGGDIDLSGEKHGIDDSHTAAPAAASASATGAVPAAMPASAASSAQ